MTAESMTPATLPRDSSTARLAFSERKDMSKAEQDRFRAAEDISQRCVKLLRKTRLQVRVVVEVFHCKSPRHMITEVVSTCLPQHLFHSTDLCLDRLPVSNAYYPWIARSLPTERCLARLIQ